MAITNPQPIKALNLPPSKQATSAELFAQIWKLSLPVLLTNLMQSLVGVIDTFMIGRLGPLEIAAAGMSNIIRILVLVMVLSVSAGAMSLVAQAKGSRDETRMSLVVRQAFSSGFLLSLVLIVVGLLITRPLLLFANSGGDPEAIELGASYLRIIFLGMPFLVTNVVVDRLMQGAGDTVTPLVLNTVLNVLNITLNFVFMFGIGPVPAFGLAGAAIGTVTARAVGVVAGLSIIASGRNIIKFGTGSFWPNWQLFQDIFAIGLPSGIQGIFRNGARLLVVSIVTSTTVGTLGAGALSIGLQVEALAFMPVLGINVAATSLVGQSLGAWQVSDARRRGNHAIIFGVFVMFILSLPIVIFAPSIIRIFDPSANEILMTAGTSYIRISTPFLLFSAVAMVANGSLRGAGDSMPGMYATLMTRGVVTVCLAWLFAFPFGMGVDGVWWAQAAGQFTNGIVMMVRWRNTPAWLTIALHKTDLYRRHLIHLSETIQERFLAEVRAPLMAQPETLEDVQEDRVIYHMPGHDITLFFDQSNYSFARHSS